MSPAHISADMDLFVSVTGPGPVIRDPNGDKRTQEPTN